MTWNYHGTFAPKQWPNRITANMGWKFFLGGFRMLPDKLKPGWGWFQCIPTRQCVESQSKFLHEPDVHNHDSPAMSQKWVLLYTVRRDQDIFHCTQKRTGPGWTETNHHTQWGCLALVSDLWAMEFALSVDGVVESLYIGEAFQYESSDLCHKRLYSPFYKNGRENAEDDSNHSG